MPFAYTGDSYDNADRNKAATEEAERKRKEEEAARLQKESTQKQQVNPNQRRQPTKTSANGRQQSNPIQGLVDIKDKATGAIKNEVKYRARQAGKALGVGEEAVDRGLRAAQGIVDADPTTLVGGAAAQIVEGLADTGAMVLDAARTGARKLRGLPEDTSRNPFSVEYVEPRLQTGLSERKGAAAQFAQNIIAFGATVFATGGIGKAASGVRAAKGAGLGATIAKDAAKGAVADFLLTKSDDVTFSNIIQGMVPEEYRESFLFALAANDNDNAVTARLKAVVEGAGIGAAADAIQWLSFGRRAAQRSLDAAQQANKGMAPTDAQKAAALEEGLDAAATKKAELEKTRGSAAEAEESRFFEANQRDLDEAIQMQNRLDQERMELEDMGVPKTDPQYKAIEADMETARSLERVAFEAQSNGYTPANLDLLPQERSATFVPSRAVDTIRQTADAQNARVPRGMENPNNPQLFDQPVGVPFETQSNPMLTDAQIKLQGYEGGSREVIDYAAKDFDEAVKRGELGTRTMRELVEAARPMIEPIADELANASGGRVGTVLTEKGLIARLKDEESGRVVQILNEKGTVVAGAVMKNLSDRVSALAESVDATRVMRAGPDGNQFERMIDNLVVLLDTYKNTSMTMGRGVRVFGVNVDAPVRGSTLVTPKSDGPTVKEVMEMAKELKVKARAGDPEAQKLAKQFANVLAAAGGDPYKMLKFSELVTKVGVQEAHRSMYNSLFSGPITHMRSALGNAYQMVERPTSIAFASAAQGDITKFRSAMAGYRAIATSVSEALKVGKATLRMGSQYARYASDEKWMLKSFEADEMLRRLNEAAKTPGEQTAARFLQFLHDFHNNPLIDWPTRSLTAADDVFSHILTRQWATITSTEKALSNPRFVGDVGKSIDSYIKEFDSKYIDSRTGEIVNSELKEFIRRGTFQGKPSQAVAFIGKVLDSNPAFQLLVKPMIPVIRTPAQVLTYVGKHTPLINELIDRDYITAIRNAAKKGDSEAALQLAMIRGRTAIGTSLVMAAGLLAANDNLTGYGPPPNSPGYDSWRAIYPAQSIRIGGQWYSYRDIEPLATIMSLTSDAMMIAKLDGGEALRRVSGQLGFSIASGLTDKSMLSGLMSVAEILDPGRTDKAKGDRAIFGFFNNYLPGAGARRALHNTLTPYFMETKSELDRQWNIALGGLANTGAVRMDPLSGEAAPSYAGGFYNANSPVRIRQANEDPLKEALHQASFNFPDDRLGRNGLERSPEDRGRINQLMFEIGLRDRLAAVVSEPWFQESVDANMGRPYNMDDPDSQPPHIRRLNEVWRTVERAAERVYLNENMNYRQRWADHKNLVKNSRAGRYDQVQEILQSPQ